MFNRRRRCRRVFAPPSGPEEGTQAARRNHSDTVRPSHAGVVDVGDFSGVPLRLVTREDTWMAPPIAGANALFRSGGVCATERDLYRLSTSYAPVRHSYGPDMLLVSDRYEFIAIQIWKVASRTLLKALGEF